MFKTTFRSPNGMLQGVSLAMKNAVTGESPDFVIDYSLITLSVGNVNTSLQITANKAIGTKVKLEWDTTVGSESTEKDNVNLVFFNQAAKMSILKLNQAVRSAGIAELELPAVWAGAEIHCWVYFSTPDETLNSASQYVGLVQF
ncbi:MAG: DUF6266 family protein [Paludibacter sp.]